MRFGSGIFSFIFKYASDAPVWLVTTAMFFSMGGAPVQTGAFIGVDFKVSEDISCIKYFVTITV